MRFIIFFFLTDTSGLYRRKLICVKSSVSNINVSPLLICSNEATRNSGKIRTHKNKRSKLVCSTSLCNYWRWPLRRFDVVDIESQIMNWFVLMAFQVFFPLFGKKKLLLYRFFCCCCQLYLKKKQLHEKNFVTSKYET